MENKNTFPKLWSSINGIKLTEESLLKTIQQLNLDVYKQPNVGDYVYSDLTTGTEIEGKTIIGIVAISSKCTPDRLSRVIPVDLPSDVYKWRPDSGIDYSTFKVFNSETTDLWTDNPNAPIQSELNPNLRRFNYGSYITAEPYLSDGSVNPEFLDPHTLDIKWDSTTNMNLLKSYSDTIFYAANQFSTAGTSAGDWYVPSIGELIMIAANHKLIDSKLQAIEKSLLNSPYWSCTFAGSLWGYWNAWRWYFFSGSSLLGRDSLATASRLLPLLKLRPTTTKLSTNTQQLTADLNLLSQLLIQQQYEIQGLKSMIYDNLGNFKAISVDTEELPKVVGEPLETFAAGAPTIIPRFIGQRYYDTTNHKEYIAYQLTSSVSDWILV